MSVYMSMSVPLSVLVLLHGQCVARQGVPMRLPPPQACPRETSQLFQSQSGNGRLQFVLWLFSSKQMPRGCLQWVLLYKEGIPLGHLGRPEPEVRVDERMEE